MLALIAAAWIEFDVAGLPHLPPVPLDYSDPLPNPRGFPLWLRLSHFLNCFFTMLLIRSGLSILKPGPQNSPKLTNDIVYERLAPGVLSELENKNPKDDRGRRKSTHHQWLTEDVGHPALAQHLHAVIGLMRASSTWGQFHTMHDRAFPKRGATLQLEFIET